MYTRMRESDPVTEETWLDRRSELDRLVREHADAALALDPSIGLAHVARGIMHFNNWHGELARIEADQALRLSPNNPTVLEFFNNIEMYFLERREEAVRYSERAVELDPNGHRVFLTLGGTLHEAGRHAEASEASQKCIARYPGAATCHVFLARSEFALGNEEAALDALRRTEQLLPGDAAPGIRGEVAYGYGQLRQAEDAQRAFELVKDLAVDRYVDASTWSWAYMGVGNYDEALRQLNTAAENLEHLQLPWLALYIRQNTWSDPILDQPEFVEVRSRLGFRE